MTSPRYGSVGWREFASNRTTILQKVDAAKQRNASRPVQTEYGALAEAAIRQWLTDFLPRKYGVTSGYIIPDLIETPGYKLYHHDVIIFDTLNAPVLWVDENPDQSELSRCLNRSLHGVFRFAERTSPRVEITMLVDHINNIS